MQGKTHLYYGWGRKMGSCTAWSWDGEIPHYTSELTAQATPAGISIIILTKWVLQRSGWGVTGVILGCKGWIPTPLPLAGISPSLQLRVWTELKGGIGKSWTPCPFESLWNPRISWKEGWTLIKISYIILSTLWVLFSTHCEAKATAVTDPVIYFI